MAEAKPSDIVTEAKKRFERAKSWYGAPRALANEDTRFSLGDGDNFWQWPQSVRQDRELQSKVCLTINVTDQHCNQIINQIRANRPGTKVTPIDGSGDKDTADMIAGLIRQTQAASGDEAPDNAAEHAIRGGEGYWRIVTDYEGPRSFNLIIRRKPIANPNMVYIDPAAVEPDRSDARWGFVFEDLPKDEVERLYPGVKPASWGEDATKTGWVQGDLVRVADYYWCEYEAQEIALLDTAEVVPADQVPEGARVVQTRKVQEPVWWHGKLVGGEDAPVDQERWPGRYLPIITVVGRELNVNGEVVRKGLVRNLKDPARMVNYAFSETIQTVALQNKAPYIAAAESIEGHEDEWQRANVENLAYLPYNAYDEGGQPLPKPERQAPPMMAAAQVQTLQLSVEQMRAASGQQNANFGIKSEAASGVGIQRLKAQGEIATFHYPDNLRRALRYEGKVILDLIQNVYDTKRVVRILGLDGREDQATLDPEHPQPYAEQATEDAIERIFNPNVGVYDVVIDTGPSYQTQRQEAFTSMSEMMTGNPQLMQVAGDLMFKAADFPMADEIAERLAKALPPTLKDEAANETEALRQQVAELSQLPPMLQQLQEHIAQLEREREAKLIEVSSRERIAHEQEETKRRADLTKAELEVLKMAEPTLDPAVLEPMVVDILTRTLHALQEGQHEAGETQQMEQAEHMVSLAPPMPAGGQPDATGAMPGPGLEPASPGDMQ